MSGKSFDLNIEKILENWEIRHAVREVIANALDEQLLTGTDQVKIEKCGDAWYIRDFGRGIKYTHLTQNENQEKLESPNVIGRFGIGLKDALATFERQGVLVQIKSKFGTIKTTKTVKHGFGDIVTLHALIEEPEDTEFVGTEFEMRGVEEIEMEAAKQLFLIFSTERVIDTTRFGQVISKKSGPGAIYINGVKVAEESNFLFSYNITLLNAAIKKAINRERSHVGRTAYADSIKKVLLGSTSNEVAEQLSADIAHFHEGTMHDELAWVDVQEHAVKILSTHGKVVMVTAEEAMRNPDMMDEVRNKGMRIITIPENLRAKIANGVDLNGNRLMDLAKFSEDYNESFVFDFVQVSDLTSSERLVFDAIPFIVKIFGGQPNRVKQIRISNTMRPDLMFSSQPVGCWDPSTESIVILRDQLESFSDFSGTLMHELVHAKTSCVDVSRDFETALTKLIGELCELIEATVKENELYEDRLTKLISKLIDPTAPTRLISDSSEKSNRNAEEIIAVKEQFDQRLQNVQSVLSKLQAEKSQSDQRLKDAQGLLAKLQESGTMEKKQSSMLVAELKMAQELLAKANTPIPQNLQKAWYRFW